MYETKKLRKITPAKIVGETREANLWDNCELIRVKKRLAGKRKDEDTWAMLLNEPREPSGIVYDNGMWRLQGDMGSLRDTRESIKMPGLADSRDARIPKRRLKK